MFTFSIETTPPETLAIVVSEALPSSIVPHVKAFDVPKDRGTFEVNNPVECVSVAFPAAQFITPPDARYKSDHSPVVTAPIADPSLVVGRIEVVNVGEVVRVNTPVPTPVYSVAVR
jgi:hypothetical protein